MAHVLYPHKDVLSCAELSSAIADIITDTDSQVLMDFKRGIDAYKVCPPTCLQPLPSPGMSSMI